MSEFKSNGKLQLNYEVDKPKLPYQVKLELWQTAFGLQKTDGLTPSEYMVELAYDHIDGKKEYDEIYQEISNYYSDDRVNVRTKEADIVSLRIAELLSDPYFRLSPATLLGIHRHLFTDVFPEDIPIGSYRNVNITKKEPVLDGETVQYSSYFLIQDALDYDFSQEKGFNYSELTTEQMAFHVMEFISNIWQIHPFREGNTRTVAVFAIKYLRQLGFEVDNTLFKDHSSYFRNALVLYNYYKEGQNKNYLKWFFENLLLNKNHVLSENDMYSK